MASIHHYFARKQVGDTNKRGKPEMRSLRRNSLDLHCSASIRPSRGCTSVPTPDTCQSVAILMIRRHSLKINARQISFQCFHGKNEAEGVEPHEHRRRPRSGTAMRQVFVVDHLILCYRGQQSCLDRTLPVGERHWRGPGQPLEARDSVETLSSRSFLLKSTHLAFDPFRFLAVWPPHLGTLNHQTQTLQFLVD